MNQGNSAQAQYAQLVTKVLRRANVLEARFDIHGNATNHGFFVDEGTDSRYLLIKAISPTGYETARSLLNPCVDALWAILKGVLPSSQHPADLVYHRVATRVSPFMVVAVVPGPRVVSALQRRFSGQ